MKKVTDGAKNRTLLACGNHQIVMTNDVHCMFCGHNSKNSLVMINNKQH